MKASKILSLCSGFSVNKVNFLLVCNPISEQFVLFAYLFWCIWRLISTCFLLKARIDLRKSATEWVCNNQYVNIAMSCLPCKH